MKIVTIIPAAGKGSRINLSIPKILIKIGKKKIIDLLINKVKKYSHKIVFVVSSKHKKKIKQYLDKYYKNKINFVFALQKKPLGMFDAVYSSLELIKNYSKIMIIWGDHIGVQNRTIKKICKKNIKEKSMLLPLIKKKNPYVEYVFSKHKLINIYETREGDKCNRFGFSDLGTFLFYSKNFTEELKKFRKKIILGKITKEQNFLPFILFLKKKNWNIKKVIFQNKNQCEGINTRKDIKKFKIQYN
jgi:bifunctional N-acetylglucosamine-1-phosphate-uridyltransferase/glucosamine-1-phosphate-acetyltransferase GlmU-like protein